MPIARNMVDASKFNSKAHLPNELRLRDFEMAMQDVYDFFFDVNRGLVDRGLARLDDMLRPAIMSGFLSDMLTSSLAKLANFGRELLSQRPSRPRGRWRILLKQHQSRNRGGGNQDDTEARGRSGYTWRSRSMDVCVRLRRRRQDGASP